MTVEVLTCVGQYCISRVTFEKQLKIFLLPLLLMNVIITLSVTRSVCDVHMKQMLLAYCVAVT